MCHLSASAIDNMYIAFPSLRRAQFPGSFWRSRIKTDLPYVFESIDQSDSSEIDWHSLFRYLSNPEMDAYFPFIGFRNRLRIWKVVTEIAREAARMQLSWISRNKWIDRGVLQDAVFRQTAHVSSCDYPGEPVKCRSFFVQHPSAQVVKVVRVHWQMYPSYSREEIRSGKTGVISNRRRSRGKHDSIPVICGFEIVTAGGTAVVGMTGTRTSEIRVDAVLRGVVLNITKMCLDVDPDERWGRDALTGIWVRFLSRDIYRLNSERFWFYSLWLAQRRCKPWVTGQAVNKFCVHWEVETL